MLVTYTLYDHKESRLQRFMDTNWMNQSGNVGWNVIVHNRATWIESTPSNKRRIGLNIVNYTNFQSAVP